MKGKGKNPEQAAKGRLRAAPDYAEARTILAQEQAERVRQIRLQAEGSLIEAAEVGRLLADVGAAARARLLSSAERLRSQHPGLPEAVYALVAQEHEDALGILSEHVKKLGR